MLAMFCRQPSGPILFIQRMKSSQPHPRFTFNRNHFKIRSNSVPGPLALQGWTVQFRWINSGGYFDSCFRLHFRQT